ncbi:hypothetical protein [Rhizobium gallicum]|uniref:hypothetical protein n=1 Tax=Rhizobium gallicum TaxID=56730 RepID=UPI001EF83606|nr:hypothetical protein [Rhizobium gallicum]ULJ73385.1 hypothetical protein L2W42_07245 [Rhizobium gallicum]
MFLARITAQTPKHHCGSENEKADYCTPSPEEQEAQTRTINASGPAISPTKFLDMTSLPKPSLRPKDITPGVLTVGCGDDRNGPEAAKEPLPLRARQQRSLRQIQMCMVFERHEAQKMIRIEQMVRIERARRHSAG